MDETQELLTIAEARMILKVARSTLMAWIYEGRMPARKFGGRWRILRADALRGPAPIASEA